MRLIWSLLARGDLFGIADYYNGISEGLGDDLLGRIEDATRLIPTFPRMGSPTGVPGVRKLLVPRTPFLLIYAVNTATVEVRRVLHARSDWREKP
ncbi:type II toxin-antitoxin system RelE/ParE family toxin [Sphingomonas gilva]|uniref:Type II toxin-antitoxin system RelE/ParE family toxin n=1 Tax=Sphingomonas gilva TaxID=2305907 RepID=A0A396RKI4_9SPHN|nr:type II toxin-antitoxin system RelE/ParE family toxin [Sphingomonas gilva]RHW16774.1 type II toxin-antitoxin system RelE/ParE family toxin [Sphingomonas gilva]